MTVFFREATNARNLLDLLPALTPENRRRVALCTDDRQPPDLLDEGGSMPWSGLSSRKWCAPD